MSCFLVQLKVLSDKLWQFQVQVLSKTWIVMVYILGNMIPLCSSLCRSWKHKRELKRMATLTFCILTLFIRSIWRKFHLVIFLSWRYGCYEFSCLSMVLWSMYLNYLQLVMFPPGTEAWNYSFILLLNLLILNQFMIELELKHFLKSFNFSVFVFHISAFV